MINGIGNNMVKCGRVYVSQEAAPGSAGSKDRTTGDFKSVLKYSDRMDSGSKDTGRMEACLADQAAGISKDAIADRRGKAPYSHLANEKGQIVYKNAVFNVDHEHKTLSLGDVSDRDQVIHIALSGGGCLLVNRKNIDELASAIGMFSPEDVKQILRTIRMDAKLQEIKRELEDLKDGEAKSVEATMRGSHKEVEKMLARAERSELAERIRNGKKETSFAIGGSAFTESQWKSLLGTVDEAFEQIRQEVEERTQEIKETVKEDKGER